LGIYSGSNLFPSLLIHPKNKYGHLKWAYMAKKMSSGAKQLLILVVISGAIFSTFLAFSSATNKLALLRPRWNVPVLCLANESITIEAETSFPLAQVGDFSASITSAFGTFLLTITAPTQNFNSIRATATFPAGVVKDVMYDLEIAVGGFSDEQEHAVKVLSVYKTNFKILVWSDTQVGYSEEYEDDWLRSYDLVREMVNQANLLNPEFVVITGDITETSMRSEFQFMYDQIMRLNVPCFVGFGNHENFGTAEFKRWCQYYNFTFDYGPDYHFMYLDTGWIMDAVKFTYFDWITGDLQAHANTPVKILYGHAGPYECTGDMTRINRNFENLNEEFINLLNANNVKAYVYGHDHQDMITDGRCNRIAWNSTSNQTRFMQTNDGRESGGFRVLNFANKQMYNVTRANSTYGRDQKDGFIVYPEWSNHALPPSNNAYIYATTNVSATNDLNAAAVTAINCTVNNRWGYDMFNNVTVRLNIVSTVNPSNLTTCNATLGKWSVHPYHRLDLANTWLVEVQFLLLANSTVYITAKGAP
jgi:3',5'-cyclic AMP phosphodiesterase CpdA